MKPQKRRSNRPSTSKRTKATPTQASTAGHSSGCLVFHAPPLPQEVVDIIVGFLQHDKLSLLQCSLVSHAWARTAATHLFRHMRWPKCEHFWTTKRAVRKCVCSLGEPRLTALLALLLSSERIRRNLRDIELRFDLAPGGARSDKAGFMPMGCVNVEELLDVFNVIPNPRTVQLSGIYGHSLPTKDRSTGQAARKLDTLTISHTLHLDPRSCATLVSYFGSVSKVAFRDVNSTLPESPVHFPSATAGKSRIQLIDFDSSCRPSSVAKYIAAFGMVIEPSALVDVSFSVPTEEEDVTKTTAFLRAATNLDSSTFRMPYVLQPPASRLPGFTSLSSWTSLTQLVAHCSARTINVELKIDSYKSPVADYDVSEHLHQWDWHQMEAAVAHQERLEVLCFRFEDELCPSKRLSPPTAVCVDIQATPLRRMLSDRLFGILDIVHA